MIGYQVLYNALSTGLMPDLDLSVDEWSDKFMVIPKSSGSNEYGNYRTDRTPHARAIMRFLSDSHPCKEVVAMVASQMFKTQISLNWFGSTVHQSPSNFLWLMPTGKLHKRIAARIDKTIAAVDVLKERVAKPNSRSAINNIDTKEYLGGTLFIATAGSAANLAEVPARRVAIDEVDRCEANVDGEGDPIKLAKARQTTFSYNRKSFYYSSPTIDGESKIKDLFDAGTQRKALAECVHCGHAQELIFENLVRTDDGVVLYPCESCGSMHRESDKPKMFKNGLWSEPVRGIVEVESFSASAMYQPYGWLSWADLMAEYDAAKTALDAGNDSMMIVFCNTRLARTWKRTVQAVSFEALKERAEDIRLRIAPYDVLLITAGVDTQDNRLAVQIVGWGDNLKAIPLDYVELHGDPAESAVWDQLTDLLNTDILHESGHELPVLATLIDIGGHRGEAVKNFVRSKRIRCAIAGFGATKIDAQPLSKGSLQDVNWKGVYDKKGVTIHSVGTVEIKHVLFGRLAKDAGKEPDERMIRFSNQFDDSYFAGIISEAYDSKTKRYVKKPGVRNEPLDTLVYAYAALHHSSIRAHRLTNKDWERISLKFQNPVSKVIEVKQETTYKNQEITQEKRVSSTFSRGKSLMKNLRGRVRGLNR